MVMDLTGYLRRIMNAGVAETFDPATDSLEAIRDFIAAMAGLGPGVSLWMFGRCAAGMAASLTVITTDNLGAALPNDVFNGEFYIAVIHNADAPGTAPEGEWRRVGDFVGATQTFTTDAFTANVEATDLLLIVHESILFGQPLARGTLDTSSATVPADSTRTEGNNYFRGHLFMTTEGATRFQPRLIVEYTGVGGIFTLDPNNPLTAAPGLVDYVILPYQSQFVPAADAAINRTPADVIGNKTDSPQYTASDASSSLMRFVKAMLGARVIASGTFTTSSATVPADVGMALVVNDFWKGAILMPLGGSSNFQPRRIVGFTTGTGVFTIDPNHPFTGATGLVPYIILADQTEFVPAADGVNNRTPADVIGNKTDTANAVVGATSSLMRYLKAVLNQVNNLAGAAPVVGSTTANWQSGVATSGEAGADLVTIGANDTRNKLHSLLISIHLLTAGALITVKMFQQVNGVERKVYQQVFLQGTDPNGLWIVQGTVGIHEALRVEVQSNTVADNGLAIHYDYMLEAM